MNVWSHVKEWSGVLALVAGLLLWAAGALGFESRTTGTRLTSLETQADGLLEFKREQERVNTRLQVWMCVTDRPSAVMAQVPCASLGVAAGTERTR